MSLLNNLAPHGNYIHCLRKKCIVGNYFKTIVQKLYKHRKEKLTDVSYDLFNKTRY